MKALLPWGNKDRQGKAVETGWCLQSRAGLMWLILCVGIWEARKALSTQVCRLRGYVLIVLKPEEKELTSQDDEGLF